MRSILNEYNAQRVFEEFNDAFNNRREGHTQNRLSVYSYIYILYSICIGIVQHKYNYNNNNNKNMLKIFIVYYKTCNWFDLDLILTKELN